MKEVTFKKIKERLASFFQKERDFLFSIKTNHYSDFFKQKDILFPLISKLQKLIWSFFL